MSSPVSTGIGNDLIVTRILFNYSCDMGLCYRAVKTSSRCWAR